MKLLVGTILTLLVSTGIIYHLNSQTPNYSGSPLFYTRATSRTPPGQDYGWPVNGSLLVLDYYAAFRITSLLQTSQYIASSLWKNIPKHALIINDPNVLVAFAKDYKDPSFAFFLIVNGTKWPLLGGGNQTANYGIPSSKIVQTTMSFLNNYPTSYYLPQEF